MHTFKTEGARASPGRVPRRSLCQRRVVKVPRVVPAWADKLDAGWRQGALALGRAGCRISVHGLRVEFRAPDAAFPQVAVRGQYWQVMCVLMFSGCLSPCSPWLSFLKLDVWDNLSYSLGHILSAFVLVAT